MKRQKKRIALVLSAVMMLTLLAGCGPKTPVGGSSSSGADVSGTGGASSGGGSSVSEPEERPEVKLTVLSGPTGVGAAKLLHDNALGETRNRYDVTVAAANDEVTAALINGDTDLAAIATNVAAALSAKTDGAIQVLAVNTLGVLYILEKGESVNTISDLKGKTLYATGQGANPEYVLNYLLTQNDVDPAQVDIQWMSAQEVTAKMAAEEEAICMLPVPAATALMGKDKSVRQAVSLSEEWDKLERGALAMGCVVARSEFVKEEPEAVEDFLQEYRASIEYIRDTETQDVSDPESPAAMVAEFELTPNAAIAAAAIPQCNLTFLSGREMWETLDAYYQILFQADPAAVGGAVPYDSFYYGME